jgi:outer membrane receptor for ferrienterochelin and colicin
MYRLSLLLALILPLLTWAQSGAIEGKVFVETNNEPIPFASVVLGKSGQGVATDFNGMFRFDDLAPNISVSSVGFKQVTLYEIRVSTNKTTRVDVPMQSQAIIDSFIVTADPFNRTDESPVSLKTISAAEIYRNPGGNRDISKVITSMPGVATTTSFRNDIIIRGGAPNENRFYLDGIEVPNINHFATQGSSGGPVGMINVNFLREVDLYTGAFPANRGNTLSSVMELKQVSGNRDRLAGSVLAGSSDIGLTLDGPIGNKSTFILSARRSYLQFLFSALGLPFLPTYNDFQFKYDYQINDKNRITILGLGAIDDFVLNEDALNNETDPDEIERKKYILDLLPVNTQWNYAAGIKWQHFRENGNSTLVFSRNHLDNSSIKYQGNIESPANLVLDYNSEEIENKIRFENLIQANQWRFIFGVSGEHATYTNTTFQQLVFNDTVNQVNFSSELDLYKYGLFGQLSRTLRNLTLSLGIRADGTNYSSQMSNPLDQLSPRVSGSYKLSDRWSINSNVGRYYQLPAYTVLGYRSNTGDLQNKDRLTYIRSDHFVLGIAMELSRYARVTVEGFYKNYTNYPFLINDSISLANLGADFGVIGSEPASSTSEGRAYGWELLVQQKLSDKVYGILAYTWVTSEFKDKNGAYVPAAWDNKHIVSITGGRKFRRNWEIGIKFRYLGGAPYTPFNLQLSSLQSVWDVTRRGLPDWNALNSKRYAGFHAMDLRVDKTWYFPKWSLELYFDVQNLYGSVAEEQPFLTVRRDAQGNPLPNPTDPTRYDTYLVDNESGTLLPSIGIMIEF